MMKKVLAILVVSLFCVACQNHEDKNAETKQKTDIPAIPELKQPAPESPQKIELPTKKIEPIKAGTQPEAKSKLPTVPELKKDKLQKPEQIPKEAPLSYPQK